MMQSPQDDEKLVAFVRRHRPVPPPAVSSLEQRLMLIVEKKAINDAKTAKMRCLIPFACAAAFIFAVSTHNWFAQQQQSQFAVRSHEEELATFLMESWQGTVGHTTNAAYSPSSEGEWLALADIPAKSSINSVYQP